MHPRPENTAIKQKTARWLTDAVFYLAILFFIIGFNFSDRIASNWYQQFMPNIGNRTISDIYFIDSLTGWAVTPYSTQNDTSYVIKTTNSGNNWFIQHIRTGQFVGSNEVFFLNINTGYTAGVSNLPGYSAILKTINGGNSWFNITPPTDPFTARDISILNEDTIWVVSDNSLTGGVFFTSNGGASWENQLFLGNQNPSKIYMYNARIGFVSSTAGLYKTTNGTSWFNASNDFSFSDIFFIDSLIGWKASGFIKKTTNGGLNWINQPLPTGNFLGQGAVNFMNLNNDTIWASGESIIIGGSPPTRGVLYRTVDGGNNWLFQVPDTSIHIVNYFMGQFLNNNIKTGWAYQFVQGGIHTTNGGDTIFLVPVQQISSEIPKDFTLYQNYPNPFNPVTNIKYSVKFETSKLQGQSNVKLIVFDITGKEIVKLLNQEHSAGTYQINWNASGYATGVYFYSLLIDGKVLDTKKMLLVK